MTKVLLIQLIAFYLVYWLADALHDSWFHKDKSYNALASRSAFTDEQRANYARLSLIFNRQWHAIDAAIKGW